jgi:hypothetical protein
VLTVCYVLLLPSPAPSVEFSSSYYYSCDTIFVVRDDYNHHDETVRLLCCASDSGLLRYTSTFFHSCCMAKLPSGNLPFVDYPRFLVSKCEGTILPASLSNCETYHSNTSQKNRGHGFESRSKPSSPNRVFQCISREITSVK